jgi:hypothetical protein
MASGLASGLGSILGISEAPLPQQFQQLEAQVPALNTEATSLENQGSTLTNQGTQALSMAQNGQLTQPQQAQLTQYQQGLNNTAAQTFASMGRNINQDTSGISTQANIDSQVNAMAQQDIQSTIALGLGETSAGQSYDSAGLGFQNAADQALIAAGQAQVNQDTAYSTALTGAFTAIGNLFGGAAGAGKGVSSLFSGAGAAGTGASAALGASNAASTGIADAADLAFAF